MTPRQPTPLRDDDLERIAYLVAEALAGNGLGAKITEIRDTVLRLEQQSKTDHELLQKHDQALYPNGGNEGLIATVSWLVKYFKMISFVVGAAVTALIGLAISQLVH